MPIHRSKQVDSKLVPVSGYQHWPNEWHGNVVVNEVPSLKDLGECDGYIYTHHQIELVDSVVQQTRSSPNWLGGMVTYATCKHQMRTYLEPQQWAGKLLVGLCPKECGSNMILYIGRVYSKPFLSNYELSRFLKQHYPDVWFAKQADTDSRGDLYTPKRNLIKSEVYDHLNFLEPPNHTRSLEYYKKSLGSTSTREDGLIPKWWRDIEYVRAHKRPPSFILDPVWLFTEPTCWTSIKPGRASVKLTSKGLVASLMGEPT